MKTACYLGLWVALALAPSAAPAQENPCGPQTILTDPSGDETGGQVAHDIQKLALLQSHLTSGEMLITFLFQTGGLSNRPPNTRWNVSFDDPAGVQMGARMRTDASGVVFFESFKARTSGANDRRDGVTPETGTVKAAHASSSFDAASGLIRIVVPGADIGLTTTGQKLTSFVIRVTQDGGAVLVFPDSAPNDLVRTGEFTISEAAVCDEDTDGVPDIGDQCPGTRAGATVDADGCEIVLNPPTGLTLGPDYGDPDTDGTFTLSWTRPAGAAAADVVQRSSTACAPLFFDNADEELAGAGNSLWVATGDWSSQPNPDTGSTAYHVPDTINQDEHLTMIAPLAVPAGNTTLTFDTWQRTEGGFDFSSLRVSTDGGETFAELAQWSGVFVGQRTVDLSAYAGSSIHVRFHQFSDTNVSDIGWFIENISIVNDNWGDLLTTAGTSATLSDHPNGSYCYRVRSTYDVGGTPTASPPSDVVAATVDVDFPPVAVATAPAAAAEATVVTLDGTGSSEPNGDPLTYAWTQVVGAGDPTITLSGANTDTATFDAPTVCSGGLVLTFRLTVSDGVNSHTDDVDVEILNLNQRPTASAGEDVLLYESTATLLSAAGTTDPDCEALTYSWAQFAGPAVTLTGANTATPSFTTPLVEGADVALRFRVTVTDPHGGVDADDVTVFVRDAGVESTAQGAPSANSNAGGLAPLTLLALAVLGLRRRRRA